ncbi:MAG: hypothetical protein SFT81_01195 [Candidatus Caenarcaniphilales bacterium]|nr:hypothetical protein [Candidatus Caenarcaniphilales bacterium]
MTSLFDLGLERVPAELRRKAWEAALAGNKHCWETYCRVITQYQAGGVTSEPEAQRLFWADQIGNGVFLDGQILPSEMAYKLSQEFETSFQHHSRPISYATDHDRQVVEIISYYFPEHLHLRNFDLALKGYLNPNSYEAAQYAEVDPVLQQASFELDTIEAMESLRNSNEDDISFSFKEILVKSQDNPEIETQSQEIELVTAEDLAQEAPVTNADPELIEANVQGEVNSNNVTMPSWLKKAIEAGVPVQKTEQLEDQPDQESTESTDLQGYTSSSEGFSVTQESALTSKSEIEDHNPLNDTPKEAIEHNPESSAQDLMNQFFVEDSSALNAVSSKTGEWTNSTVSSREVELIEQINNETAQIYEASDDDLSEAILALSSSLGDQTRDLNPTEIDHQSSEISAKPIFEIDPTQVYMTESERSVFNTVSTEANLQHKIVRDQDNRKSVKNETGLFAEIFQQPTPSEQERSFFQPAVDPHESVSAGFFEEVKESPVEKPETEFFRSAQSAEIVQTNATKKNNPLDNLLEFAQSAVKEITSETVGAAPGYLNERPRLKTYIEFSYGRSKGSTRPDLPPQVKEVIDEYLLSPRK